MPVKLQALREGSVVHAHTPIYQLTAEGPYAPLCTYLETLLTQVCVLVGAAELARAWPVPRWRLDAGALHAFGTRARTTLEAWLPTPPAGLVPHHCGHAQARQRRTAGAARVPAGLSASLCGLLRLSASLCGLLRLSASLCGLPRLPAPLRCPA